MIFKILLILLFATCGSFHSIYGNEDDCGEDLNLNLWYAYSFSGRNISISWEPVSPTDCPLLYLIIVRDYELGVIRNETLEEKYASLDEVSPCIPYEISIRAINVAFPTVQGPLVTMGIVFSPKAQIAPRLESVDIQATSISMNWTLEGDANRCPLTRLYVDGGRYFNISVPLQDLENKSSVPVEINSLQPNSMYYFQVYVENSGGLSPVSQLAVQTLDS